MAEDTFEHNSIVLETTEHGILVDFSDPEDSSVKKIGLVRYQHIDFEVPLTPDVVSQHVAKGDVLKCTFQESTDLPSIVYEGSDVGAQPKWVSVSAVLLKKSAEKPDDILPVLEGKLDSQLSPELKQSVTQLDEEDVLEISFKEDLFDDTNESKVNANGTCRGKSLNEKIGPSLDPHQTSKSSPKDQTSPSVIKAEDIEKKAEPATETNDFEVDMLEISANEVFDDLAETKVSLGANTIPDPTIEDSTENMDMDDDDIIVLQEEIDLTYHDNGITQKTDSKKEEKPKAEKVVSKARSTIGQNLIEHAQVVQLLPLEEGSSKFNSDSILVEITSGEFSGTKVSVKKSLILIFGNRLNNADICQLFHYKDPCKINYLIVECPLPGSKTGSVGTKKTRKPVTLNIWFGPQESKVENVFINPEFRNWWQNHGRNTRDFHLWIKGDTQPKSFFPLVDDTYSAEILDFFKEGSIVGLTGILVKIKEQLTTQKDDCAPGTNFSENNDEDGDSNSAFNGKYAILLLENFYVHGMKINSIDPRLFLKAGDQLEVQLTPRTTNLSGYCGLKNEFQRLEVNLFCPLGFLGKRPDNPDNAKMGDELKTFMRAKSIPSEEFLALRSGATAIKTPVENQSAYKLNPGDFTSVATNLVTRAAKCSSEEDPQVQGVLQQDAEVQVAMSLIKIFAKALSQRMQNSLVSARMKDLDTKVLQAKAAHQFLTSQGTSPNVTTAAPQTTLAGQTNSLQSKAELVRQKLEREFQEKKAAEQLRSKAVTRDMKKVLQSYKTAKEVAETNASPLELLREFLINRKEIISDDDAIWFGDIGFPSSCRVNLKATANSTFYTLGALNHFMTLRPNRLNYVQYSGEAIRGGFAPIQLSDVENISDYLLGIKPSIQNLVIASHKQLNPGLFTQESLDEWAKRLQNKKLKDAQQMALTIMQRIEQKQTVQPAAADNSPLRKSRFDQPFNPAVGFSQHLVPTIPIPVTNEVQTHFSLPSGQPVMTNQNAMVLTGFRPILQQSALPISSVMGLAPSLPLVNQQQPSSWQDNSQNGKNIPSSRSPTLERMSEFLPQPYPAPVQRPLSPNRNQLQDRLMPRKSLSPLRIVRDERQGGWIQQQTQEGVRPWSIDERPRSPSRLDSRSRSPLTQRQVASRSPSFRDDRRSPTFQAAVRQRSPTDWNRMRARSPSDVRRTSRSPTLQQNQKRLSPPIWNESKSRSPTRYFDNRSQSSSMREDPKPKSPIMWRDARAGSPTRQRDLRSRSPSSRYLPREERSRSPSHSSLRSQDSSVTSLMSNLIKTGLINDQQTYPERSFAADPGLPKRSSNSEFLSAQEREYNLRKQHAFEERSSFQAQGQDYRDRRSPEAVRFQERSTVRQGSVETSPWSRSEHSSKAGFSQDLNDSQSFSATGSRHQSSYRSSGRYSPEDRQPRDGLSRAEWDSKNYSAQVKPLPQDPDFGPSSKPKAFFNPF